MLALWKTLKRVGADIAAGRHLESYAVTGVGLVLVVLDLIGQVDMEVSLTVTVAALSLLVFKTTTPPQQAVDLDSVLLDRDDFGPFREVVRGRRQVWIYGPSAINALREDIEHEVLSQGGEVRVILQDPDSPAVDFLIDQLDTNDPRANLRRDLEASIRLLSHIADAAGPGRLEFRLLSYSPGFSMVVADPSSRDGLVIVEFLGFRYEHISQRMHIEIRKSESQHWFDHWVGQFQRMWDAALPPLK